MTQKEADTLVLSRGKRFGMAVVLGGLAAMGPICTDLYLPALPQMADFLQTGTSQVQLSITSSLVGLSLGQLLLGPFSDAHGRRMPLLVSLALFSAVSVLCARAESVTELVIYRFLQGLAGSGGVVLSRAVACDLYSGVALTKFFALLMLIYGIAPFLGAVVCGQILRLADLTAVFYFLTLCGVALFSMVFFGCQETLPREKRNAGGLKSSLSHMGRLLKNRLFMCYVLIQGFIMAGFFSYISASPFVLQNIYGLTAQQFSYCFGTNGLGVMLIAQLTGWLSAKFGDAKVLRGGILVTLAAALFVFAVSVLELPVLFMLAGLFSFVGCLGLTMTASFTLAVASQEEGAGSASGLLGVAAFLFGAVMSPVVGVAGSDTAVPMGAAMVCTASLAFFFYQRAQRQTRRLRDS